jgi:phage host-nuclease inhibitor protein Gam
MNLKIGDRLALINQVLPQRASMVDMIIRECIADKVKLTTEDITESGLTELPNGTVKWNMDLPGCDFTFSDAEVAFLRKQVTRLDGAGEITALALAVCRKIQEEKKA